MSRPKDIEREKLRLSIEIEKLRLQKERYERENKAEFWKPFEHQQRALDYLNAGKKTVLLQGGNRIGKTVLGACVVGCACLGIQPWDKVASIFGRKPVRVRIICVDWEHHANEVIVPTLKEWLPVGSYETKKNNTGVDAFWKFKNGSTIELMTHIQDTKQHEGWKGNLVWADEPLPRDKYVANKRGLIDYSGAFLLTMTAVYEAWILDEIVLKNDASIGCVTEVPMAANPLLSNEDIKNYSSSLTDDERQARIAGGWLQLSGRVLKDFDRDIHVIESFKMPTDWPVTPMIDFHLNTKQAIGFYAVDKNDRHYVVDEVWEHIGADEIADEIIRRKKSLSWRIDKAFIDPLSKGDTSYVRNRFGEVEDSFSIISRKLGAHGIMLEVGSKDKKSGINNIKNRLTGVNKMPSLYFLNNCERHIFEIQRWVYDKQGDPVKLDDHFMENLYRYTLSGTKYTDPVMMSDYIKMASKKYEPVNVMAGY